MSSNRTKPQHTCPAWLCPAFDNPLRKLVHDPIKILKPYVQAGDTVLDVGCGMGYFSLGLAELVGEGGKVIAADLQDEMLAGLSKRAAQAGLLPRIQFHRTEPDHLGLFPPVDFILAFWMVHEVQQPEVFLQELYETLRPGGKFLLVEPRIHVSRRAFNGTLALAESVGFHDGGKPWVNLSRAVVLSK
jgi:ubiquinone/menaquinone biosynthesis C-methylase UbiE